MQCATLCKPKTSGKAPMRRTPHAGKLKTFLPLQMQHHGKANNEMKHKLPECFRQERLMDAVVNIFCRCKCNTTGHCKKSVQAGFNERTCKHFPVANAAPKARALCMQCAQQPCFPSTARCLIPGRMKAEIQTNRIACWSCFVSLEKDYGDHHGTRPSDCS